MLPIANAWRAADGTKQEAMCKGFMLLWIQGVVGCDEEQSEIILSAGKGKNKINPAAIDAARAAFRYNVITNGVIEQVEVQPKAKASNHAPVKAASRAEAAIIALVMESMTKARALELLNAK
jgi:hypothetical protein